MLHIGQVQARWLGIAKCRVLTLRRRYVQWLGQHNLQFRLIGVRTITIPYQALGVV
jgi:hypothetical protein